MVKKRKLPPESPEQIAHNAEVRAQGPMTYQELLGHLIKNQELTLNRFYEEEAPIIYPKSEDLKWTEFTPLSRAEVKEIEKDDKARLKYWFNQWAAPVSSYAGKEHRDAQRIYFGILNDVTGMDRADFNWAKFRRRYFKMFPDRYAEYKANQKSRKGKKK